MNLSPETKERFQRNATQKERERIAAYAIKEIKYPRRIAYLSALEDNVHLIPVEKILEYATSMIIPLRRYAITLLTKYKDKQVGNFARKNLFFSNENIVPYLQMLINNYEESDKELFEILLSVKSSQKYTAEEYQTLSKTIIAEYENRSLPISGLKFAYENALCSHCRNQAVKLISQDENTYKPIANECLYDCNPDTVEFVKNLTKTKHKK